MPVWWRKKESRPASQSSAEDFTRLSVTTQRALSAATWAPGRKVSVSQLAEPLTQAGFTFHARAGEFLSQFGGLEVIVPIAGHPAIQGFVHFDPVWVARFLDPRNHAQALGGLLPRPFCPIGTTSGNSIFILMDEEGVTYLLDRDWSVFAVLGRTAIETLEVLCDGRNGRVDSMLLIDDKPSGIVLREGNEQRYWGLEHFPDLRAFFPAASLEPARRPPTVHAMPQVAQKTLRESPLPRERWGEIVLTNGGFTADIAGGIYYAAHTENVLAIRMVAPFQVSSPPPGLPARPIRTGECIPFTPPSQW